MINEIVGGALTLSSLFSKDKEPSLPKMKRTETPNLKMMDATMVSDQKEQAIDTTRKELKTQTDKILTGANAAQGLRVGSTFKDVFDIDAAASANLAGKMVDIDNQALAFNNSVLQWTANFNAAQEAAIAGREWNNAQVKNAYNSENSTGSALGGLGELLFKKDNDNNYILPLDNIFKKKNNIEEPINV
ncbi:MAG TPA: hypothetical protein PKY81_15825 [bacterium]|nr:hypothetical protein [bacterium]